MSKGKGKGKSSRGSSKGGQKSKSNLKFKFHTNAGGKEYASFVTMKDKLIAKVNTSFTDSTYVVQSIENMTVFDISTLEPILKFVSGTNAKGDDRTDTPEYAQETTANQMIFHEESKLYISKKDTFETNMDKLYRMIMSDEWSTTAMQQAIMKEAKFESEIKMKPIELLKKIRTLAQTTKSGMYPMASALVVVSDWINMKQFKNESLIDYAKRFKQQRDVFKAMLGTGFLDVYVERTDAYKKHVAISTDANQTSIRRAQATDDMSQMKKDKWQEFVAYVFIQNCDGKRYKTFKERLVEQFGLKNDQYPKCLEDAIEALSTCKYEKSTNTDNGNGGGNNPTKKNDNETGADASFAQTADKDRICHVCGEKGHVSGKCPLRKETPPEKYWIREAERKHFNGLQCVTINDDTSSAKKSDDDDDDGNDSDDSNVGFSGMQLQFAMKFLRHDIMLDTGSTFDLFKDSDLLYDLQDEPKPLRYNTNGGTNMATTKGTFKGIGRVWHDPDALMNILSLSTLKKQ
ncbi:MAG: hypothetical protein AAF213_08070, partial [Pseudomonadota bacterium]